MEQLNKVELRGRIGIVRTSQVGDKSVCRFTVATNSLTRSQDNATVDETTWHNCTLWSGKKYPDLGFITVGAPVEVVGRIRNYKFTGNDGNERVSTEIVVKDVNVINASEPLRPENLM